MTEQRFFVNGTLPGLNDYIAAINAHRFKGNKMKQDSQDVIGWAIAQHHIKKVTQAYFVFNWYEKNKKRDLDNVAFAKKMCLDALVKMGVLPNDGWGNVLGFEDHFFVDKDRPGVEVIIREPI